MLSAWNQSGEDVLTEEVELADGPFFCPAWQQELLPKQGRKVVAHFAKSMCMLYNLSGEKKHTHAFLCSNQDS
jgi:competence CoiA-like predicted nuclease